MNRCAKTLLSALEQERRYVAKELHDGVAQTTLQLGLQAGICSKLLEHGKYDMLEDELAHLQERIQLASGQVRDMISDMRSPLTPNGESLVDYLKGSVQTHIQRGGPDVTFDFKELEADFRVSEEEKLALTRLVQEALLNIRKHSHATRVRLHVSTKIDATYITIIDNGQGSASAMEMGAGLKNMKTRLEAIGGSLMIENEAKGSGLQITARLPK
ncbi:MAG: hypothetical protein KDJ65_10945 [Anaerolineae bacterium]|nr:hypothetical protein [Anaerolineae bacterium]